MNCQHSCCHAVCVCVLQMMLVCECVHPPFRVFNYLSSPHHHTDVFQLCLLMFNNRLSQCLWERLSFASWRTSSVSTVLLMFLFCFWFLLFWNLSFDNVMMLLWYLISKWWSLTCEPPCFLVPLNKKWLKLLLTLDPLMILTCPRGLWWSLTKPSSIGLCYPPFRYIVMKDYRSFSLEPWIICLFSSPARGG